MYFLCLGKYHETQIALTQNSIKRLLNLNQFIIKWQMEILQILVQIISEESVKKVLIF